MSDTQRELFLDLVVTQNLKLAQAAKIADIGYENAKVIYRVFKSNGRRLKKRTIKNNLKNNNTGSSQTDSDEIIFNFTKAKPAVDMLNEKWNDVLPVLPKMNSVPEFPKMELDKSDVNLFPKTEVIEQCSQTNPQNKNKKQNLLINLRNTCKNTELPLPVNFNGDIEKN